MQSESERIDKLKNAVKVYMDFPKKGLGFLDIFCIASQPDLLEETTSIFADKLANVQFDKIYMLESRGFLFAIPLSLKLKKPCYPIRKKGKLPGEVIGVKYDLEYGTDEVEIQKQNLKAGDKVIIMDDVLATGGTMNAAIKLIQDQGATVERVVVVNIIEFLKGHEKLLIPKDKITSLYYA